MMWVELITGILGGIPIGYYLGRTYAPKVKEKFRLERPYKKWCIDLYCDLWEFNETYLESKSSNKISNIKVSTDYRGLHNALIETPKYLLSMRKGGKAVKELKRLHSCVDNHWHKLQDDHNVNLQQEELPKHIQEIIDTPKDKRDEIRKDIEENIKTIKNIDVDRILKYLESEAEIK